MHPTLVANNRRFYIFPVYLKNIGLRTLLTDGAGSSNYVAAITSPGTVAYRSKLISHYISGLCSNCSHLIELHLDLYK